MTMQVYDKNGSFNLQSLFLTTRTAQLEQKDGNRSTSGSPFDRPSNPTLDGPKSQSGNSSLSVRQHLEPIFHCQTPQAKGKVFFWKKTLYFAQDDDLDYVWLKLYSPACSPCGLMKNQISDADAYRKELKELASLMDLTEGPKAKKAIHDRMLLVAFKLKEATS